MTVNQSNAQSAVIAYLNVSKVQLPKLTKLFTAAGFKFRPAAEVRYADIGIVDLRNHPITEKKARLASRTLRKKSPDISTMFLIDPQMHDVDRATLRKYGEVIVAKRHYDHVIVRMRQLLRLRNFAEETGERIKSLASLGRLSEFPVVATPDTSTRILIIGGPGPIAITVMNAARQCADHCVCVLSSAQAMRALESNDFDCAVLLPMAANNPMQSLARSIYRQPRHAMMATLQIADHVDDLSRYAKKGAKDFMLSANIGADLAPRLKLIMRRARLTRAMREFLVACEGSGVRDVASGAFTSLFMSEHGARLCDRADQTGRSMSLALVELSELSNTNVNKSKAALRKAARLVNRVTRADDFLTRVSANKFVVICPATKAENARNVAARIEGVLANTAFMVRKDGPPRSFGVRSAILERERGATIEETVAALFRNAETAEIVRAPRLQFPQ
ncbi:MAG: diguanylate cyclase [Marinicaulis sp.]|nr:diguanylate cyclase [Marinicaulis sp.]NNL90243.1 diguanylate cyclase [Marinicaulis sp.]